MRLLFVLVYVVFVYGNIHMPDGFHDFDVAELTKVLSSESPSFLKAVTPLRTKVEGTIILLYGTLPRFYMKSLGDLAKDHSDEVAAVAGPRKKFEEIYKTTASGAKTSASSMMLNMFVDIVRNISDDELQHLREYVDSRAQFVDGFEILDYTQIFAPVFYSKCSSIDDLILKKLNGTVDDCAAYLRTEYEKLSGNAIDASHVFEETVKQLRGDEYNKLATELTEHILKTLPVDLAHMVNNLGSKEAANITDIFKNKLKDTKQLVGEVRQQLPSLYGVLTNSVKRLTTKVTTSIEAATTLWNKKIQEIRGKDAITDTVLEKASEEIKKLHDDFVKNISDFVEVGIFSSAIELCHLISAKELANVRKFVGAHAKDTLRTEYRKRNFDAWRSLGSVTTKLELLRNFIDEQMDNVTSQTHDAAAELLSTVETSAHNPEFITLVKKTAVELEAKMSQFTMMQKLKIHQIFPFAGLLLFNDLPDEEIAKIKEIQP